MGCGNSEIGEDMVADGFRSIECVDFAANCIGGHFPKLEISSHLEAQMQERATSMFGNPGPLKYSVMDVRAMTFPER